MASGKDSADRHKSRPLAGIAVSVLCFAAALLSCLLLAAEFLSKGFDGLRGIDFVYLLFTVIFAAAGSNLLRKIRSERASAAGAAVDISEQTVPVTGSYSSMSERIKALDEIRQNQLSGVSLISGEKCQSAADVRQALFSVQRDLDELSRTLQNGLEEADRAGRPEDGFFSKEELDILIYDTDTAVLESKWKEEYENIRQQIVETALRKKYCEGQLDEKTEDMDRLQCVEEETVAVKEKIAYLRSKADALKIALEVLEEAASEIRRTVAPELNSRMSRIIAGLTDNRYTDLRGDDSLRLRAAMPGSGDVKEVPVLSGGTADQMYLALRLAVAELLTDGSEKLPLIMDEVFSQYDDRRTELALKYLQEEYKNRQILIFTCKNREIELARKILGDEMNYVELENENL